MHVIEDGIILVRTSQYSITMYDADTQSIIAPLSTPGSAFDIDNGQIVVGYPNKYDTNSNTRPGEAYILDAKTGNLISTLLPENGGFNGGRFGNAVAIDNGVAIVGAEHENHNGLVNTGAAYLYDANTGVLLHELVPDSVDRLAEFGVQVAIQNGIAAVTAQYNDFDFPNDPLPFLYEYVYLFDVATGNQINRMQSNKFGQGDNFGDSMDIDNGVLAVGAPSTSDNGLASGSVFLYHAATGEQITIIQPDDAHAFQRFGKSVSLDNGVLAVGAYGEELKDVFTGSAYLFNVENQNQIAKLIASDGGRLHYFGNSISIDENLILIGAPGYDDDEIGTGAIYMIDTDELCPADLTGDFTLDFFDISAFLTAYAAQDPIADFNDDTLFDFFDISAFLTAYSAGCP